MNNAGRLEGCYTITWVQPEVGESFTESNSAFVMYFWKNASSSQEQWLVVSVLLLLFIFHERAQWREYNHIFW